MDRQFLEFHKILTTFKPYWHYRPFSQCIALDEAPWAQSSPQIVERFKRFSLDDWAHFEEGLVGEESLDFLIGLDSRFKALKDLPFQKLTQKFTNASQVEHLTHNPNIKQRKNEQLLALISHLPHDLPPHILEWCGGKGFLSRLLRIEQKIQTAKIIDWDHDLIQAGKALQDIDLEAGLREHQINELAYTYEVLDAMSTQAIDVLHAHQCIFAIHACGCLHRRVIEQAQTNLHQTLVIAPCCYHLDTLDEYQPMSKLAQQYSQSETQGFRLNRYLLRLATQQRTHASERRHALRQRSAAFRLGFEQLLLHLGFSEIDQFPSLSRAQQRQNFREVCLSFANALSLNPQPFKACSDADYDRFERLGHARLLQIIPLEQMRHVFRKSLEYWLCLDRCLALIDKGFDVQLTQFCDLQVTPRNLMITAQSYACPSP